MKYSTQKLRNLGLASLCHGSGLRETAEITSPTLMDFGAVSENYSTITCHARKFYAYLIPEAIITGQMF